MKSSSVGRALLALALSLLVVAAASSSGESRAGERPETELQGRPDLSAFTPEEGRAMESACRDKKDVAGPAAYYQCLRDQMAALRRLPGRPDLSAATPEEVRAMETACKSKKELYGPAVHYQCLRDQVAALQRVPGRPDLSAATPEEAGAMESACRSKKDIFGPAAYYQCLRDQMAALQRVPGRPDLSAATPEEARAMEDACRSKRDLYGPAAYYQCLGEQVLALRRAGGRPDRSGTRPPEPRPGAAQESAPESSAEGRSKKPLRPRGTIREPGESLPRLVSPSALETYILLGVVTLATFWLAREAIIKLATRPCIVCRARTPNPTQVCDGCQARITAEHEAARRAEEARQTEQRQRRNDAPGSRYRSIEDLERLGGEEFERLVIQLFEHDGYMVIGRADPRDHGIDLILQVGGVQDVARHVRSGGEIGAPAVRELFGAMIHSGARRGFLITTASFSRGAGEFAAGKRITLIDGQYLLAWINGSASSRGSESPGKPATAGLDPYEVLGLPRGASAQEIRAAYLRLIAQYHPDKVMHLGKEFQDLAKEKTQAIVRAYETLTGSSR